jgi:hypothetical protein
MPQGMKIWCRVIGKHHITSSGFWDLSEKTLGWIIWRPIDPAMGGTGSRIWGCWHFNSDIKLGYYLLGVKRTNTSLSLEGHLGYSSFLSKDCWWYG